MSTLFKLTATAACIVTAGMAAAETDQGTKAQGEKSPENITCHDIVTMDTAVVPGTLYYIAGYGHGSKKAGMGDTAAATGDTGTDTADTGDAMSDTAATDTGTDTMESGDTGDAAPTDMAASETDTAASDDAAAGSDEPQMRVVRVSGFYEIPVEEVMTVCSETPDRNVSDVVEEKRGAMKDMQTDTQ